MPPFAPPNGRPAAAHFHVIVRASLKTSSGVTISANLIPPFPGPVAVLSITNTPFIPVSGSYTCKTFSGPRSSISCHGEEEYDDENVDILADEVIVIHINLTLIIINYSKQLSRPR